MKKQYIHIILMVFVLFVGIFLRIYKLDFEEIWYDESVSIQAAKMTFSEMFHFTTTSDVQDFPPFYYIVLKFWIFFFGDSPFSVRMPSVIFGVLSIWMMYSLGKLLWDENHGLLAALLMAISPFDIYYSQETRVYALQVLLICVSIYYFMKAMKGNISRDWWIYVGVMWLSIHFHFFSLFIWTTLFLYQSIYQYLSTKSIHQTINNLFYQWVILVGLIPLLIFRIMTYSRELNSWVIPFKFYLYRHTLINLMLGVTDSHTKWMYHLIVVIIITCIGYMIYHFIMSYKNNKVSFFNNSTSDIQSLLFTSALMIIPIILFTVISLAFHDIYVSSRYLIIILPAFLLWFSRSILLIPWRLMVIILFFLYVGIALGIQYKASNDIHKTGMKPIADYMQKESHPEDLITFVPGYHEGSFFYYFKGSIQTVEAYTREDLTKAIQKAYNEKSRIWVVIDPYIIPDIKYDPITNLVTSVYTTKPSVKEKFSPKGIQVYLYE